jgi:hypothetical protein
VDQYQLGVVVGVVATTISFGLVMMFYRTIVTRVNAQEKERLDKFRTGPLPNWFEHHRFGPEAAVWCSADRLTKSQAHAIASEALAKEVADPAIETFVDIILGQIRVAAKSKKFELRLADDLEYYPIWWDQPASDQWKMAKTILERLNYIMEWDPPFVPQEGKLNRPGTTVIKW